MSGQFTLVKMNPRVGGGVRVGETDCALVYHPTFGTFSAFLAASIACSARQGGMGAAFSGLDRDISATPLAAFPAMSPVNTEHLGTAFGMGRNDNGTLVCNPNGNTVEFLLADGTLIGRYVVTGAANFNQSDYLDALVTWMNANGWTNAAKFEHIDVAASGVWGIRWPVADNLTFDHNDVVIKSYVLSQGAGFDEGDSVLAGLPYAISLATDATDEATANIGAGYVGFNAGTPLDWALPVIVGWYKDTSR